MPIPPQQAKFSRIRRTRGISPSTPSSTADATGGDICGIPGIHMIPLRSQPVDRLADIRRPEFRPSSPAKVGLSQNFARSGGFKRNLHLLETIGRNFAPRGSVADCVESSENPENPGGPTTQRPAGSTVEERGPGAFRQIDRNSAKSPLTWGDWAEFRTSWICGRLRRIIRKSREISAGRRSVSRR